MTKTGLVALAADGKLPEWIMILPLGEVELADGREPFRVDLTAAESIVQRFKAGGVDLVIDYEHQSLAGERAPAAGWIKELQARPDGLWGRVEWTSQGSEYLKNREYRYFSPVLRLDPETRRPTALLQLGLTNTPAIRRLPPLVAKLIDQCVEEALEAGKISPAQRSWALEYCGRDPVGFQAFVAQAPKLTQQQEEATAMLKKLIAMLGLPPENTEDQVLALVVERVQEAVALKQQTAVLPEIATVLALKTDASVSEIIGTIKGLKGNQDRLAAVETELTALKAARALDEAEAAVDAAIVAKKITPAMREIKLKQAQRDLAEFKAEMAVAPVILSKGGLKLPKGSEGKDGLSPDELAVCKQAGIKPEAFKASREQLIEQGLLRGEG